VAYIVSWLIEQRVIVSELAGPMTKPGSRAYLEALNRFIAEGLDPSVHVIMDVSRRPALLPFACRMGEHVLQHHSRLGQVVVITPAPLPDRQPAGVWVTSTWEAAIRHLLQADETVGDLRFFLPPAKVLVNPLEQTVYA
jgi:hypothetical protein